MLDWQYRYCSVKSHSRQLCFVAGKCPKSFDECNIFCHGKTQLAPFNEPNEQNIEINILFYRFQHDFIAATMDGCFFQIISFIQLCYLTGNISGAEISCGRRENDVRTTRERDLGRDFTCRWVVRMSSAHRPHHMRTTSSAPCADDIHTSSAGVHVVCKQRNSSA